MHFDRRALTDPDIDPFPLSPKVDPLTNFPPLRRKLPMMRKRRPLSPSRPTLDLPIDPVALRSMSEESRMDCVLAVLRCLSTETLKIAFASGRSGAGKLSLKQRRALHRRLFRSALKRIRAIDPSLFRE